MATRLPRAIAIIGGIFFVGVGTWAMVDPRSFFETAATFEPYNQHFLQDVGAFQIGLGAVLLLAGLPRRADALAIALIGVGVAAGLHAVSHVIGRELGGHPEQDIPLFAVIAVILLAGGILRLRSAGA
jgi:hypothetical protein